MLTREFVPGQRWVSSTESELGLGIVASVEGRRVTLRFPARGEDDEGTEERTYAIDNAPLSRVEYPVGERVSSADGRQLTITDRVERAGCLVYLGIDAENRPASLEESELDSFVQFSRPQDRLLAGQVDENSLFELRAQTLAHRHEHQRSPAFGLLGPRVELLPHQIYIASEVASRHAPRVLLADEVGLGKTIEAGLIMHQQLVSGRAARVLVVVPENLAHQWLVEMLRRFNLAFTLLDEERSAALESSGNANPFESAQLVLCTLAFLSADSARHAQALAARWDLLVVDEAHHLNWSEGEPSASYRAVEALAHESTGLLLLTGTPERLGADAHFARLRLLDPDRYHDLQGFRDESAGYQRVSELIAALLSPDPAERLRRVPTLLRRLEDYLGAPAAKELDSALGSTDEAAAVERVVRDLLDRHGTGRVLFRNTRAAVGGFAPRRLRPHALPAPPGYSEAASDAAIEARLRPEVELGPDWPAADPRVEWLVQWLRSQRPEKALVICARSSTAQELEAHLRLRAGIRCAVFHEGLSLVARDRAAAYFAEPQAGAQALVCSEIGSEGRNFQFAHHLVLFDLPLDPDLLEQRIGRLDRIGQHHPVEIHVPYYRGSAQDVLLRWYHEGTNAIERASPAGDHLYRRFAEPLERCLSNPTDAGALDHLIQETHAAALQHRRALQQGRDRLLELNSCRPERARALVRATVDSGRSTELADYMARVFDHFGVESEAGGDGTVILRPSNHLLVSSFPGLPEDGLTATYERSLALGREDIEFLTWEHPMVRGAVDLVLGGEFGSTALCTLASEALSAGTLLLEALFVLHCPAPRRLQVERFLSQASLRILVDANRRDLSEALPRSEFDALAQPVPQATAQELIRHTRSELSNLLEVARERASQRGDALIAQAVVEMERAQGDELERLRALAELNPNIRRDELTYAEQTLDEARRHLQRAQLKLDGLRVAVAT